MHELSLCKSLVTAATDEYEKIRPRPRRLVRSRVVVGALRRVVPEFMQDAYKLLVKDTPAAGSELEVITAPVTGRCGDCGWKGELAAGDFTCGDCGSGNVELTGGMELYLDKLEVESDE